MIDTSSLLLAVSVYIRLHIEQVSKEPNIQPHICDLVGDPTRLPKGGETVLQLRCEMRWPSTLYSISAAVNIE